MFNSMLRAAKDIEQTLNREVQSPSPSSQILQRQSSPASLPPADARPPPPPPPRGPESVTATTNTAASVATEPSAAAEAQATVASILDAVVTAEAVSTAQADQVQTVGNDPKLPDDSGDVQLLQVALEGLKLELQAKDEQLKQAVKHDDFSTAELLKDLRLQVAGKTQELSRLHDLNSQLKSDNQSLVTAHQEKLAKIKLLFAAANKNISDARAQLAERDQQLAAKTDEHQQMALEKSKFELALTDAQQDNVRLRSDLQYQQDLVGSQSRDKDQLVADLQQQLRTTKLEFVKFKQQATKIINEHSGQQTQEVEMRIFDLESANAQLVKDKAALLVQNSDFESQLHDCMAAMELETAELNRLRPLSQQMLSTKSQLADFDRELHSARHDLDDAQRQLDASVNIQVRLQQQVEDANRDKLKAEYFLQSVQEELSGVRDECNQLKTHLFECQTQLASMKHEQSSRKSSLHVSQHNLSAPTTPPANAEVMHQLQITVAENEARIQQLLEQERLLKQELRNVERNTQTINTDYLRSVVVKFAQSPDAALVPVLGKVLALTDAEVAKIREAVARKSWF